MTTTHYVLDAAGDPVPEPDLLRWGMWYETADEARNIAKTELADPATGEAVRVSTIFLGLDHNFGRQGGPLLFETMIFEGPHDGRQWRYRTRAEALAGHEEAVRIARGGEETTDG